MAQVQQCTPLVTAALQSVQEVCADTGRNQACYGNDLIEAQFQPGFSTVPFSEPGETIDVAGLRTLQSSSADPASQVWGITLMRLQANLPDTLPGQTITMIVLGGTQVENAIAANPNAQIVELTAQTDSVVRAAPAAEGQIVGVLVMDDSATVLGKSPDGLWLRVELADRDQRLGWIPAAAAQTIDVAALPVIDPERPGFQPDAGLLSATSVFRLAVQRCA